MRAPTRKHGPAPLPRKRLNPKLYDAVRRSDRPNWQLARTSGFNHYSRFSALITAETIPASTTNIEHLYRIADAVGFDKAQLFLDGDR